MAQSFIDWREVESKDFGTYRYTILKVENADHRVFYRGFVIFGGKDLWLEGETLENTRSGLMMLGQQNS